MILYGIISLESMFIYRQIDKVSENNDNLKEGQEKRPNTPSDADEIGEIPSKYPAQ